MRCASDDDATHYYFGITTPLFLRYRLTRNTLRFLMGEFDLAFDSPMRTNTLEIMSSLIDTRRSLACYLSHTSPPRVLAQLLSKCFVRHLYANYFKRR